MFRQISQLHSERKEEMPVCTMKWIRNYGLETEYIDYAIEMIHVI